MPIDKDYNSFIREQLPSNIHVELIESLEKQPLTSIRINPKKKAKIRIPTEGLNHTEFGFILPYRPRFIADPAFHSGLYYVQESNSMWIGEIVKNLIKTIPEGVVVLDLCAAPGGKSTHISSILGPKDLLVANEVISSRNSILFENLCKWGVGNFIITKADAKDIGQNKGLFDIIVCDVPCSGEGLFRKDSNSKNEWSTENVNLCSLRQQRIVHDVWNSLKPGGFLIYSTCTYNTIENEDNVNKFVQDFDAELVELEIFKNSDLFSLDSKMYRCLPFLTKGEGLFFAIMQKPHDKLEANKKNNKPGRVDFSSFKFDDQVLTVIKSKSENYFLNPTGWIDVNSSILNNLPNIIHYGTPMGPEFHGQHKFHPAVALHCSENKPFPTIEIPLELTSKYFRKEFMNEVIATKGTVGLKWNNHNIGTANSIKNGLNNLWPSEWRVRDTIIAESIIEQQDI